MVPRNEKTVIKNTGIVLACSAAIGVCIWVFDYVAASGLNLLLSAFGG